MDPSFDISCHLSALEIRHPLTPLDARVLLPELLLRHADAFNLMRLTGVHPTLRGQLANPYNGSLDTRDFRNVGEHSMACSFAASCIAEELSERNVISEEERFSIEKRALLHDITKRLQIFRKEFYGTFLPPCQRQIEAELLELQIDTADRRAILQHCSQTGGENLVSFLQLRNGQLCIRENVTLADKIVRIADNMTSSSVPCAELPAQNYFVTWKERIILSNFASRYPEAFTLTLYSDNRSCLYLEEPLCDPRGLRPWGNSLQVENYLTQIIADELCSLIDPKTKSNPEVFLKELINSKQPAAYRRLAA